MSGGHFNYTDNRLLTEMYGWDSEDRTVIPNVYKDPLVSQLMYDLLQLTKSLDWYLSGDTDESAYIKDLSAFKVKWFKNSLENTYKKIADAKIEELRQELYGMINKTGEKQNE